MVKVEEIVGPGTAGIAQRIQPEEKKYELKDLDPEENLYALRPNKVMPCSHNQY